MGYLRRLELPSALRLALVLGVFLATNVVSHAQSCALCYTQAASANHRMIQGLRSGILVLIVPPMLMSIGIAVLAYKKRNRTNDTHKSSNDW